MTPEIGESLAKVNKIDVLVQMMKTYFSKRISTSKIFIVFILLTGMCSICVALFTTYYSILDLLLDEKLRMHPGLPPFEFWKTPPSSTLRIFIFEVINSNEFLKGDEVLKFRQIGPIVYRENIVHENITFHPENDTMSFTAVRTVKYLEEENEPGILNRTVIVPNLAVLGMASKLHDSSFIMKAGYNMMLRQSNDSVFQNTTVYNYLWNMDGSLMRLGATLVPFMVPIDNSGVLHQMYHSFSDRQNVKIGTAHGHEHFFELNLYNDRPTVPGFRPERGDCYASIENTTEGAFYPQRLTEKSVLKYFRKTICRPGYLHYTEDVTVDGMHGKKYVLPGSSYDRTQPLAEDCYRGENGVEYPDGLSDASKCYYGFPIVVSNPHFLNRSGEWMKKIEGMEPNKEEHESYVILEPLLGVPLKECARSQSNIFIHKLSGFSNPDLQKFSDMVVPMFWGDVCIHQLPALIRAFMILVVVVVPILQPIGSFLAYGFGFLMILYGMRQLHTSNAYMSIAIGQQRR